MSAASDRKDLMAHVAPFVLFMLGLGVAQGVHGLAGKSDVLFLAKPEYWVYPLQTLVCAVALATFWRYYDFGSRRPVPLAVVAGMLVFFIWVSPQMLFGQAPRLEGFDPSLLAAHPGLYGSTVVARFLRLVIVVPLIEEIFWRGFLQRYLIDEQFTRVPIGKYTPLSFWGVVIGFTLVHSAPDWPAAFITGIIYGWIAVRSKSLVACIVAHATTNLLLGGYIMATQQWGFW